MNNGRNPSFYSHAPAQNADTYALKQYQLSQNSSTAPVFCWLSIFTLLGMSGSKVTSSPPPPLFF